MGKKASPRRLADNEAMAFTKHIRVSPQKLNLVVEGIRGMKVGGRRRLVVRPGLAYGSRRKGKVPPGSTLIFEVELLEIME